VVAVGGADAKHLLQNLITSDLDRLGPGDAGYGALLTPQGKLQFDFIIFATGDGFLFDLPRSLAAGFVQRLGLYRLRSAVAIDDRSSDYEVVAVWGGTPAVPNAIASAIDPRLPALGLRAIVARETDLVSVGTETEANAYARHRIALGVPEGGADFSYGEVFPHDADIDQLHGVAFDKGCFVGQEVVSRMEHRGTARRRMVIARGTNDLEAGAEILAGGQPVGTVASVAGDIALASVRLDRAARAFEAGEALTAGGRPVELAIPDWARFGWPAAADNE